MLVTVPAAAKVQSTELEIAYLLNEITTSNCTFVRNGKEYNAERAAQHLRMKYDKGRQYIASAEDFIDKLASESSWTGKPYTIVCATTGSQLSHDWLSARLAELRASD